MTTRDGTDLLDESTFRLDGSARPRAVDLRLTGGPDKGKSVLGIYKLEGDRLTICAGIGDKRPREFTTKAGDLQVIVVYQRQKK